MRRFISLFLLAAIVLGSAVLFCGCGKKRYELVLVTDGGSITNRGYNQSAWDAMTEFAIEKDLDCRYFIPSSKKAEDLTAQLRSVAKDGAKVIIASGKCFETAVYDVQREYPGVKFILIDGKPHSEDSLMFDIPTNTTSVMFASEQSGFLAGYAAVFDGFTSLAFMGGVPDENVRAYGYGFLQGVKYAAEEFGCEVSVVYHYTGDNEKTDKNKQTAAKMYEDGVELIFACGGGIESSVIEAAVDKRSVVICSDTDKRYDSAVVLTSAVKGVSAAVKLVLKSVYDTKDFEYSFGGKSTYFDAANGGAGLASFVINDKNGNAFDRFYKFDQNSYNEILQKLCSKSVNVKRSINIADPSGYAKVEELIAELSLDFINISVLQ